ncbi:MAG TPA: glycosyltransferase family 39 protein [Spirochaetota bacterium]|nr:glycosyltransferase family 39 protein [Spirochaetota bacterium]HRT77608.1 glycosyltransferase family 39 protein [Spirochaetota bacterium]
MNKLERSDIVAMAAIALAALAASVPFFYDYLYCIDSANFALGMHYYSMEIFQPHPPGYPLFVFLGKALRFIAGDDNLSLILLANIFALAGILLFYRVLAALFGRNTALWGTLIFAFNPVFWFYREVALTYAIDCFATAAALYTAVLARASRPGRAFYAQMALLALVAGFRPTSMLLLAGIALFTFIIIVKRERETDPGGYVRTVIKMTITGSFIFAAIVLAWLAPTVMTTGGIANFLQVIRSFSSETSSRTSILDGAPMAMVLNQVRYFNSILIACVLCTLPLLAAGIAALCSRALYGRAVKDEGTSFSRMEILLMLACTMLPPVFVYTLVHFGQPGYILILLPAIMVVAALGIKVLGGTRWGPAVIALSLAAQVFLITVPGTTTYPFRARLYGRHEPSAVDRVLKGITPYILYFNLSSVREDNLRYSLLIGEIRRFTGGAGPGETLLIIDQFHPFHEGAEVRMNEPWASHMKYYFPGTDTAIVSGAEGKKGGTIMKNYRKASEGRDRIRFDRRARTAVIVTQQLDDRDIPKGLRFTKNRFTYVADISQTDRFSFLGLNFARK